VRTATLLLVTLLASTLGPWVLTARAPTSPVSEYWWSPEDPVHPSPILLYARVVPGTLVQFAVASFCLIPPSVCLSYPMAYNATMDAYTTEHAPTQPATNGSSIGASYAVLLKETSGTLTNTTKKEVPFVSSLDIATTLTGETVVPGETVSFEAVAHYNSNASLPARASPATVTLDGAIFWTGLTEATGGLAFTFTASAALGAHTLRATITNSTLSASEERMFTVVAVPVPDFMAVSLIVINPSITAGDTVNIQTVVKNVGNAEGNATVVLSVDGSPVHTERVTLSPGAEREVTGSWVAIAGTHAFSALVSGSGDPNSVNNVVSAASPVQVASPDPGPPYLVLATGIGIAAAAGVAAILLLRRKRRPA